MLDRGGQALAVAARSPADEQSLLLDADGITTIELRVADNEVGRLRVRARGELNPGLLRLLSTLIASEVERVRAPELASEEAAAGFVAALLARELTEREEMLAAAREVGLRELERGASVLIVHAHPQAPAQEGWRTRLRAIAARAARAAVAGAVAVLSEREIDAGAEVVVLLAGADEAAARRAADGVLRDLEAGMSGFVFVIGRSRPVLEAAELARAADEALLAANVAEGDAEHRVLAFEETGAYRLLLSRDEREPRRAAALLRRDGRAARRLRRAVRDRPGRHRRGLPRGRRQRRRHRATPLHPPPHDPLPPRARARAVRPGRRLKRRSREAVASGLKAMRVLGMSGASAPSTEPGHAGGRVPRR